MNKPVKPTIFERGSHIYLAGMQGSLKDIIDAHFPNENIENLYIETQDEEDDYQVRMFLNKQKSAEQLAMEEKQYLQKLADYEKWHKRKTYSKLSKEELESMKNDLLIELGDIEDMLKW